MATTILLPFAFRAISLLEIGLGLVERVEIEKGALNSVQCYGSEKFVTRKIKPH